MKAVVAAFNQEKALVGAFSVITNLRMELFQALITITSPDPPAAHLGVGEVVLHAARQADARAVDEANQAQTGGRQQAAGNRDIEL